MASPLKMAVKIDVYAGKVTRRIAAKRVRILFKIGGYTLRAYRRGMRYRKGPSRPGSPPSAHKTGSNGPLLREASGFAVDKLRGRVVIGPKRFRRLSRPTGKTVPEILNEGGVVFAEHEGKRITAELEARPFLAPTYTDGRKRLDELIEEVRL